MQIYNRKLYMKYKQSIDPGEMQTLIAASILASSLEERLATGHSMDLAIRCVRIDHMNLEMPGMENVIEFLIRCWIYGDEFAVSLWKLKDRRQRSRHHGTSIEINMV